MKVYKAGTRVFCDFLHYKPKGKVTNVIEPGDGKNAIKGQIQVKLTETAGPYKKDEILVIRAYQAVPVAQIRPLQRGEYFTRINTLYRYE